MAWILSFSYKEVRLPRQHIYVTGDDIGNLFLVIPWSLQGNMSCFLEVSEPLPWSSEVVQGSQGHGAQKQVGTTHDYQCSKEEESFVYHLWKQQEVSFYLSREKDLKRLHS